METKRNDNAELDSEAIAAKAISDHRKKLSSAGGKALVAKRGKEHMSALGKASAAKRWPKKTD